MFLTSFLMNMSKYEQLMNDFEFS